MKISDIAKRFKKSVGKKFSFIVVIIVFIICAICASVLPEYCYTQTYSNGKCDLSVMSSSQGLNENGQWLFFVPLIVLLVLAFGIVIGH